MYNDSCFENNLQPNIVNDINHTCHNTKEPISENMSENNFGMGIQIEQQVQYSKPVDIMQSKLIRNKNRDHPFISYLNVNSLRNKIHDIRTMIHDITPEVFTVSETKIDNTFPNAQFMIDGYHDPGDFRKDRNKNGGGLITYIKRGIPHKQQPKIELADIEITYMYQIKIC